MTIQTCMMILLHRRVVVPQKWIGFIQGTLEFETLTLSQCSTLVGIPSLVSTVDFERYAAFTELNCLLQQGYVSLTEQGFQEIDMFWYLNEGC